MSILHESERFPQVGVLALLLVAGCGSSQDSLLGTSPDHTHPRVRAPNDAGSDGATDSSTKLPTIGSPIELVPGSVSIVGVTTDGWAVFREGDALRAAHLNAPGEVQDISDKAGSVLIRGMVVFNWANVDWMANVGDLSIWTAAAGTRAIGPTLYAEGLVAASKDGNAVAYTTNRTADTVDLVIASSDLSNPSVAVKDMGRGSDTTCTPNLGFVGERLIVGSCPSGARAGDIQRFEHTGKNWQSTTVATGALPMWSADASGEKIFFQSENYAGQYVDHGEMHLVDMSVSSGIVVPDGSAVLYSVSDQLRRTALPDVNPIAIVTTGYSQLAAFSSGFHYALYSSKVTYDTGTKRDLRLTPTDAFNPTPIELVKDPSAGLARSCMTMDEKFVFYLTDTTPTGSNLHIASVDGTERTVLPGVVEAAAASGGTIVFTDNSSDPDQYPVVADLKMLDLSKGTFPQLLEAKILDGKSFQVDAAGTQVVYMRSGVDRDAGANRTGLYLQSLR
jgi:hypothetical protein